MLVFYWMILVLDWLAALTWMMRVLICWRMLRQVPDLTRTIDACPLSQPLPALSDLVGVRWAQGAFGVVENMTKNLFALFRFRPELLCGLAMFTLFPLAACLLGRALWWPTGIMLIALLLT